MPLDYCIKPAHRARGYTIMRVADEVILATYRTYGEASLHLGEIASADRAALAVVDADQPAAAPTIDPIFDRAGTFAGQLTLLLTHTLERTHAEQLLTLLEAMVNPAPIHETRNWFDPTQDGDLCDAPRGPLAYVNFLCGSKDADSLCELSFPVNPRERPVLYAFSRDELDLDRVVRTLASLLALLASPKVHAAKHAA